MSDLPPAPPDSPRHLRLSTLQWIGLPCIILLPVLALCGVFSKTETIVHSSSDGLVLQVAYASQLRYKENNKVAITVENTANRDFNNVVIRCSPVYFTACEHSISVPPATQPYTVDLGSLPSGARRSVHIEGRMAAIWNNDGYISATAGSTVVFVGLHTFVFP